MTILIIELRAVSVQEVIPRGANGPPPDGEMRIDPLRS